MNEPHTHPERPTLALRDASYLAQELAQEIYPLPLSVEELAWILEHYLDKARNEGYNERVADWKIYLNELDDPTLWEEYQFDPYEEEEW